MRADQLTQTYKHSSEWATLRQFVGQIPGAVERIVRQLLGPLRVVRLVAIIGSRDNGDDKETVQEPTGCGHAVAIIGANHR